MFKPTFLYIKQHKSTGKLYFGKTYRNPEKYYGSGTKWLNHINYHGKSNVETLWYCLFLDEKSINEFALMFSRQNDIVSSNEWLNLIEETGLGDVNITITTREKISNCKKGNTYRKGKSHTQEAKEKNRLAHLGKKHSEETLQKMRGKPHLQTEETKNKIRNSLLGTRYSEERIEKMKKAKSDKGLSWYTDGISSNLFVPGTEPNGWQPGRKLKHRVI